MFFEIEFDTLIKKITKRDYERKRNYSQEWDKMITKLLFVTSDVNVI